MKAPSSNHQRRWELVTLTDKAIIMDLAKFIRPYPCRIVEPKTPQQEMFKIAYPRQRSMVEEAACVILPFFKQKYPLSEDKNGYGLMDYGASWALVENMLLAATAEGLGSVVHIPVKKEPEQIREFLKVPDSWCLPALVVLRKLPLIRETAVKSVITKSNLPVCEYSVNPYVGCTMAADIAMRLS